MAETGGSDLLVAYNDTDAGRRAASFAAERAALTGETVDVVYIGTEFTEDEMRDAVGQSFVDLDVPVSFQQVSVGGSDDRNVSIRAVLADVIEDNDYEIVVMGNEKHGILHDLSEGSVSSALIGDKMVPILLVP